MTQITVNRISGYSNKLRKIKLILDNQEIEEIKDGEIKTIKVTPGKHKLIAKIDWCKSNEIELNIKEEENRQVILKGTNSFLALYYITFGRNSYLKLESMLENK
jgi:hypothetical protein